MLALRIKIILSSLFVIILMAALYAETPLRVIDLRYKETLTNDDLTLKSFERLLGGSHIPIKEHLESRGFVTHYNFSGSDQKIPNELVASMSDYAEMELDGGFRNYDFGLHYVLNIDNDGIVNQVTIRLDKAGRPQ